MAFIEEKKRKELESMALKLRGNLLEMIGIGNAGHLGGSSSLAEAIAVLYFHQMRFSAASLKDPNRDRLVLSKGHAALIQYAALCEAGCFPRTELARVKTLEGLLQGHPDLSIPGIEAVTGSLGQGLSISLGMALALRLDKSPARVYAIMGDGEQSEGQLWEAAMAAAAFKADNLTAFLDWNKVQATGPTKDIFSIPNLPEKWSSFGWNVIAVNGHKVEAIIEGIEKAQAVKGKPTVIILDTIKGKDFSFAEGNAAYHNGILTEETYAQAQKDLETAKARSL
ncbi:MAG: transketolase [Spirochaetaceae bacterium]|nr:transketolase [Spirochaetaceae bacterium]